MLTWAYPDFLAAALGLAVLGLLLLLYARRTARLGRRLGLGAGRLAWKLPLRLLAGALLVLAWLGPALGVRQQAVRTAGQDVWLLVDVSRSMDAADVTPTRLLRTQAALRELAAAFPADRLGLIVFGAEAYVQCPLTYDQSALDLFLNTLSTKLTPPGPTTLREAPLLQIAAQTNAQYVALSDKENGLGTLVARLRTLPAPEASQLAGRTVAVADNRYRYPLGVALVLLLIDSLITVRVLRPDQ